MNVNFVILSVCMMLFSYSNAVSAAENQAKQWSLHQAAGLPDWMKFHIEQRTRYETVNHAFRTNADGGDQAISYRTNVFVEFNHQGFRLGGEFIDSGIELDDANTPANVAQVDRADLLQAYLGWKTDDFLGSGLMADVQMGRQTIDYGSRRLFSRSRFRNTVNTFTGLDFSLSETNRWQWRSFFVLPVSRLPSDRVSIDRDDFKFDEETTDVFFTGTFLSVSQLAYELNAEVYLYYLNENDSSETQTFNRRLFSPGLRWYRKPKLSEFDFEIETVIQVGESRASKSATDTNDLDHFSYLGHAQVGYSFDFPWQPRLILQYDYATGDRNPNDENNGKFQPLFGARRFEYGPTGIWGAFARSNINSPGYRIKFKPTKYIEGFFAHRGYWLAENHDTWAATGVRDRAGESGDFLGHQLEVRLRWKLLPKLLSMETGWAHLFKGEFAQDAPNSATEKNDSNYFYMQTKIHL